MLVTTNPRLFSCSLSLSSPGPRGLGAKLRRRHLQKKHRQKCWICFTHPEPFFSNFMCQSEFTSRPPKIIPAREPKQCCKDTRNTTERYQVRLCKFPLWISLYKIVTKVSSPWQVLCRSCCARSLCKAIFTRCLKEISAYDLCKRSLGKISVQALEKRSLSLRPLQGLCTRSLQGVSWQDLCTSSLKSISQQDLCKRSLNKISVHAICASSLYELSCQDLWKRPFGKISVQDI